MSKDTVVASAHQTIPSIKLLPSQVARLKKEEDEEQWISGEELCTEGSSDEESKCKPALTDTFNKSYLMPIKHYPSKSKVVKKTKTNQLQETLTEDKSSLSIQSTSKDQYSSESNLSGEEEEYIADDEISWKVNRGTGVFCNSDVQIKNQGRQYQSKSGKSISEKVFDPVSECCKRKCADLVDRKTQEAKFNEFWNLADYDKQNISLSTSLKLKDPTKALAEKNRQHRQHRLVIWTYILTTNEKLFLVCKQFLIKLLKIGKKRIEVLQKKMLKNVSLLDLRGKNNNHNLKLTENIKKLILLHCHSIPHRSAHYNYESSSLKYFENPTLGIKMMYESFLDYYESVTGNSKAPISESTYANYFNKFSGFTFQMSRTDVCNVCFENENSGIIDPKIINHKEKAKQYFMIKKEMLEEKNVLCLEFDFGQNLPLPKLPVSEQLYKRLMELYVFNVHVHNTDASYMFILPEGIVKKDANTVCNFVLYVIKKEFNALCHKKIYLMSEACGQNRNYTVLRFFSSLSTKLNIEINYLYPVRGHSFNQCDRNFGLYAAKKKYTEKIETLQEYINIIKNARNPPFITVQQNEITFIDYEKVFDGEVKNSKISTIFLTKYFPDGQVHLYEEYYGTPKSVAIEQKILFDDIDANTPPVVGVNEAKINDVKSLLKYLKPQNQTYYVEHFEKVGKKAVKQEIIKKEAVKKEIVKKQKKEKVKSETTVKNKSIKLSKVKVNKVKSAKKVTYKKTKTD